ncbi:LPS biosynthesis protein [Neisseria arctica]|uniref:LPS-assembly protein LptD n=1 Tax=Neisseria arctica TaxID=1470200 RepID=A0A0J0YQ63_9NEIS|nr:LPS-assembly protein LptD [Neisseria arctica]KLT72281.1 LPS biosynthesis protein [Neisseria arctica]UOO86650.1 LPS-assembly protein LptD [Neisseria arctica]
MARLFSLKPLVLALGVAFSATAYGQNTEELSLGNTCLSCTPEKAASTAAAAAEPAVKTSGAEPLAADYTRITADEVQGQTQVSVRAQGDVIIERNNQILNAPWVEYDQQREIIRAGDTFTLQQNGSVVSGRQIEYNLAEGTGKADHARLSSEHEGRRLQSVSESAELLGNGRYKLTNTKFNTCEPGDASWYIRANSIEADTASGIGVAKHASLVFGGVPVLYTPWADFPLNGNRKSGLLVPTLKIGSDGVELETPYYLNLAPNYDATVTPGIISNRGVQLGGQFRYLQPTYSGVAEGKWMPADKRSEYNNRYHVRWNHQQQFGSALSGGISYNQVSDDDYYRDFYGRADIANNVNLNRQAWLNLNTKVLGGNLSSYATVQKYQTLANANGYKDEPYAIMPRLSTRWQRNFDHAQANIFGQFTRFDHDSKQAGSRIVAYPGVKWDFHNQWGYIRPKVGLHATYYNLDSFENKTGRTTSRVLPIMNVDAGMTFERKANLFGNNYLQTLEPRVFYNYIPTKAQNDLPNFDSSENSFNYEQLFRENLYSGNDRINAANSISTAVQTRILNPQNGAELFRAGVGQKFYITNDNVLLDGSISNYRRNRSDWVAFAHGNLTDSIRLDTDIHYNQNQDKVDNFAAGIRYNPEPGKVLSARYKYGRNEKIYLQDDGQYFYDKLQQVDLAAQWPLRSNLYAVARFNYALKVNKPLEQLIGLEYKSNCGCWSASVVAQHYVTGLNSSKNAVFFNLQLKDLSNIGNNPFEQLRLAIPGYSKTNEVNTK